MRPIIRPALLLVAVALLSGPIGGGCGPGTKPPSKAPTGPPADADPAALTAIQTRLSEIINEASIRYAPLDYQYNEDLLTMLDRAESDLASASPTDPASGARLLPKLDASEEREHFREVIRRWQAKTGKDLRAVIDPMKAEVAARKSDAAFHAEFHKRFSAELDDFIRIEVEEMRERRNRAIHKAADELLNEYRETQPELVRYFEKTLSSPPYALTDPAVAPADRPTGTERPKS